MNSVPGLSAALKNCDSDKSTERTRGLTALREIFSNRENVDLFNRAAGRQGGDGWVDFFQCLFHVVSLEKKAAIKETSKNDQKARPTNTAANRLAASASFVRRMAERTVHLLSRKPFLALFTHMTTLLVHNGKIYEPVAIDYLKALRTLLRYPPHLEHLDSGGWRTLMGICWSALLGERVSTEDTWEGSGDGESDDGSPRRQPNSTISASVANEIVALIPVLLSSSRAPLIAPCPRADSGSAVHSALGIHILLKIHQYLDKVPPQATVPPEVVRSLNLVLAELELNNKEEFTKASLRLFPQLANLWTSRNKGDLALREQLLVAMRIMLPFVTHWSVTDDDKSVVRESMTKILDSLSKEAVSKGSIKPLDLDVLRFRPCSADSESTRAPFQLTALAAGFGFDTQQAINWAAIELYAACYYQTYESSRTPPSATPSRPSKRQRTEGSLAALLRTITGGLQQTRLLACQVLVFFLDKYWANIRADAQAEIRSKLLELLDDEESSLQDWSFAGLATLAMIEDANKTPDVTQPVLPVTPSVLASRRRHEQSAWERLWAHAIRKTSAESVSRAACFAADVVLRTSKVDRTRILRDVHTLLKNVDIQGPPGVFESSCSFLANCVLQVRADVGLYSANLEDKVLDWFTKTHSVDGSGRSRTRLGSATPANILALLGAICNFAPSTVADATVTEQLPDCTIVTHMLSEAETDRVRQTILYGTIPDPAEALSRSAAASATVSHTPTDVENLLFMQGRPRKLSNSLAQVLVAAGKEWQQSDRPNLVTPERLRKSIDLVVLAFLFQATIQANGLRPDSEKCLVAAAELLDLLVPHLGRESNNITSQLLVWRGFAPLYETQNTSAPIWPILLKPESTSGIRRDILPPERYASFMADGGEQPDPNGDLLSILWQRPETSEVLGKIIDASNATLTEARQRSLGTASAAVGGDDDDFGPIRNADADTMPPPIEVKEAQRSTQSLLKALVDFRLRGAMFSQTPRRPRGDNALVNLFLTADAGSFVRLGFAICQAIQDGSLKVTVDAVDIIIADFWARLETYAFKRDGDLVHLAIVFLTRTINIWLSPESGLTRLAIDLARYLVESSADGKVTSWQARLAIVLFIDEYLDYDPSYSAWQQQLGETDEADVEMGGVYPFSWGPLTHIQDALFDADTRVRFRAASSAAGLHYLPDLPEEQKHAMYSNTVQQEPTAPWDALLTFLLWKLNTCVASAQLRSTTIFHLYEVANCAPHFLPYLQPGLEAVAHRLGLESLKPLFLAHANVIVTNQLRSGQLPLSLPPAVYGCSTRKELAQLILDVVGPTIMWPGDEHNMAFFTALCDASSVPEDGARGKCFPLAAAIGTADGVGTECEKHEESPPEATALVKRVEGTICSLPVPQGEVATKLVEKNIETIVASLFGLLSMAEPNEKVAETIHAIDSRSPAGDIFLQLMAYGPRGGASAPPVLDPADSSDGVLRAHSALRQLYKSMSKRKMLFDGLVRLFYAIHEAFLVNEQYRYLRAIAVLVSLYRKDLAKPMALHLFLRNMIDLLCEDEISAVVLSMLQWAFGIVVESATAPPQLDEILIRLGTSYVKLKTSTRHADVVSRIEFWIADKASEWQASETMRPALQRVLLFWPEELSAHYQQIAEPDFAHLSAIAERSSVNDPMTLCKRLAASISGANSEMRTEFLTSTFWHIKKQLNASEWDRDGATAFLDLLYLANGEVHAPSLQAIKSLKGPLPAGTRRERENIDAMLRVMILSKVIKHTQDQSYRLRKTAFEVLQMSAGDIVSIGDQIGGIPQQLDDVFQYLVPSSRPAALSDVKLDILVDETAGWVTKAKRYELWAGDLALLLASLASHDDPFYAGLQPLLQTKGKEATDFLPYLVQATLTCGAAKHMPDTQHRMGVLTDHFTQVLQSLGAAVETLEMIIQIVLHLRNFQPPYATGELSYNQWLNIDPLVLSEAAGRCGAFASSLLFLEMANDYPRDDKGSSGLNLSDARVQAVMYSVYSNVEDPDGFYGIQNNDVMDSLLRRLKHEGESLRAFGYNVANFEASYPTQGSQGPLREAVRNFHDLGFNSLAGNVMKAMPGGQSETDSGRSFLELAWRMGDWDVPLNNDVAQTSEGRFYNALRSVHREMDYDAIQASIETAVQSELACLQAIGVERMTEIKKTTLNLLCLRDVARWTSNNMRRSIDSRDFNGTMLNGFVDLSSSFDFPTAERLTATRLSMIRSAAERESKNQFGDLQSDELKGLTKLEVSCHLRLSELARKEGNLQASVNAVTSIRQLESSIRPGGGISFSDEAQDEFSQMLWAQGEHSLAIQHVGSLSDALTIASANSKTKTKTEDYLRRAVLLGRSAHWNSLAKLKSAEDIKTMFSQATDLASKVKGHTREQAKIAHDYAVFADRHYAVLSRSPELERLKSFVDRKQHAIQRLDASLQATPGSARHKMDKDQQELDEERKAKRDLDQELQRYLQYALRNYAAAIFWSDEFDDSIIRLVSIWLEQSTNEAAMTAFARPLNHIPSHKFIFLGPQLAARLYRPDTPTTFNSILNGLMLRLGQDHPYHILYQVITLAYSTTSSRRASTSFSQEPRATAAAEIMDKIKSDTKRTMAQEAGKNMTTFANAAVSWCYYDHDKKVTGERPKPGQSLSMPSASALAQCKGLPIPIATAVPPVDLTRTYASVPTIHGYERHYKLAGGVHRPAIMSVIDTLGQKHVQLFKGDDEVRQDAVMEQVFELTNRLLQRDRRAAARNLTFRTYTVVPLAERSGIIEFVGNTMAIGEWLKDAHSRYRKGIDVSQDVMRKSLDKIQSTDWASPKMVTTYQEKMASFKPVMRHFFAEKRREPLAWFTMRLNYARSVAVTSIVGYMVGLGDRHCSNILIDTETGEFVQIDFGIVFDEGQKLRIPEKVPFRLTNDVVDGLGITGVNGTFRRCSEQTLRVLRDSSELILTVLEVFKHDPLYSWTGDAGKMRRAQGGGRVDPGQQSTTGQDKAEKVLSRIRLKLGRELSVEYAVNQLIQQARDVESLAKIFIGWQSWL
ncbi:Serine/threonine-protein kinase tel1 [Vanrija albida]|uniref:Serine/threonine-protein kinase Tel1 n=1 Tax=Vanrija albida TaxID=181172 RepID=A0ABR3Q9X0_9TREE